MLSTYLPFVHVSFALRIRSYACMHAVGGIYVNATIRLRSLLLFRTYDFCLPIKTHFRDNMIG